MRFNVCSEGMRVRRDVCRAVLITSLVWMMVDVVVLFYFIDPGLSTKTATKLRAERRSVDEVKYTADIETQARLEILLKGLSFSKDGPGEMGSPVHIDPSKEQERKEKFKLNQFNLMASDMISINRSLPDYRSSKCRESATHYKHLQLPLVSIIIVFHNEAWSTLLRTLHSVVNRSPLELIKEIILIDDLSDRPYLKKPLDLYIQRFPVPVHLVHLKQRSGLIRARLEGSKLSKGKVLLFLDAHVEVTQGWLEPLLYRVATDRKRVVAPIIDVISDETFEYITASDTTWGGFNWHLNFRWYPVPKREMERRNHDRSAPIQTPTIAGGLFAIDRQFFYDIGSYDEGMQVWGGENLEISFRVWTCGGSLEIHPCSRVGHVFRKQTPYTFPGGTAKVIHHNAARTAEVWTCGGSLEIHPCSRVGHVFRKQTPYTFPGGTAKVIHHNAARTAEVWMDEYKEFFYKMVPAARSVDVGDLADRKALRENLQCRSFRWYLENIYPEAPIPRGFKSIGQIKNPSTTKCVDTLGRSAGEAAGVTVCHGIGGNQAWSLTSDGEVRSDETCLAADRAADKAKKIDVKLEKCSTTSVNVNHQFDYDAGAGLLKHRLTGRCMELFGDAILQLRECIPTLDAQKWQLEGYET
uniref:Polypeptide N-acetylgalactosaminyltransferase n=1 Tax=Ascaris lumbricoides TaxID=6252 RepID=A0A9J2PZX2_ASCLU